MTENKPEQKIGDKIAVRCPRCGGSGGLQNSEEFPEEVTCPFCNGSGEILATPIEPPLTKAQAREMIYLELRNLINAGYNFEDIKRVIKK